MADETLMTGQTDTAPATQQAADATGTAPDGQGQTQQQQDTGTAAQADGGDGGQSAAQVPEQYAFTAPEGYVIGDEFHSTAKELGLTQEQAQKLIDFDVQREQAHKDAMTQAAVEWANATKADPEIGGEQLAENAALARKAVETFGTPALKQLLDQSGLGNHPEFVRAFYRVGKAISEDKLVTGGASTTPRSQASTLFPNQA